MDFDNEQINRALFDLWTHGKWRDEPLEVFACSGCGQVFLGVTYCHALYIDGRDLTKQIAYNRPEGTDCPNCSASIQGKGMNTRTVSYKELESSPWAWLAKR
jgi:hypothetical protein